MYYSYLLRAHVTVQLFSALYSMLPSSKHYLVKGGFKDPAAGFIMMACFVAGFFGIQVVSRLLHRLMPSHVVDCDHTHDDVAEDGHYDAHSRRQSKVSRGRHLSARRRLSAFPAVRIDSVAKVGYGNGNASESSPLLAPAVDGNGADHIHAHHETSIPGDSSLVSEAAPAGAQSVPPGNGGRSRAGTQTRRPSMLQVQKRVMSFMKDTKSNCDDLGPCYGYSDPCGQECFKHLGSRSNTITTRPAGILRTTTAATTVVAFNRRQSVFADVPEDAETESVPSPVSPTSRSTRRARSHDIGHREAGHDHHSHTHEHGQEHDENHDGHETDDEQSSGCCSQMSEGDDDVEAQHHHHVPTNGFLSIGLQTVIAIGIHKFPEGFVTYATNHANPSLGFNVFMALFVHNIAEGFAMALPLYLALGSRLKAMAWAALLGGLSQPLGAAAAALWFRLARRSHVVIDSAAYACLFAATAGIMTSVALQLFVESLSLNHNRNLGIFFAFLGMTLLGLSSALVAD